jgi:hypothetical protein
MATMSTLVVGTKPPSTTKRKRERNRRPSDRMMMDASFYFYPSSSNSSSSASSASIHIPTTWMEWKQTDPLCDPHLCFLLGDDAKQSLTAQLEWIIEYVSSLRAPSRGVNLTWFRFPFGKTTSQKQSDLFYSIINNNINGSSILTQGVFTPNT